MTVGGRRSTRKAGEKPIQEIKETETSKDKI